MPLNPHFLGVRLQLRQKCSKTYTENWSVRPVRRNLYMYVAVNFRSIDKPQYQVLKTAKAHEIQRLATNSDY